MSLRVDDPLGRSWLRRGYQDPATSWGQSVPDLWAETPITITRRITELDEYGGFSGSVPTIVWSTIAHVEVVQMGNRPFSQDQISGPTLLNLYMIYTKFPSSTSQLPMHGDFVDFIDPQGHALKLLIRHVFSFSSLHDHLEMEAVEYS
jgi:hypothetical protein